MVRPPILPREYSPTSGQAQPRQGSMFFFEKKEPKNFSDLATASPWKTGAKSEKSFCFFFFRKRRILAY
jgi:hypothetical protein